MKIGFFDYHYVRHLARGARGIAGLSDDFEIDFAALRGDRDFAYLYDAPPYMATMRPTDDQVARLRRREMVWEAARKAGFEVRLGRTTVSRSEPPVYTRRGIGEHLAVDMLDNPAMDNAICHLFFSANIDFVRLVETEALETQKMIWMALPTHAGFPEMKLTDFEAPKDVLSWAR
jgi:hypothetical protein